jgi:hypothetical protein
MEDPMTPKRRSLIQGLLSIVIYAILMYTQTIETLILKFHRKYACR